MHVLASEIQTTTHINCPGKQNLFVLQANISGIKIVISKRARSNVSAASLFIYHQGLHKIENWEQDFFPYVDIPRSFSYTSCA